jgi:hypothetical protein
MYSAGLDALLRYSRKEASSISEGQSPARITHLNVATTRYASQNKG